jgi:hypothetical protein
MRFDGASDGARVEKEEVMSTKKLSRAKMQELSADIGKALKAVAAKHGLSDLHVGAGSWDPTIGAFHFKVEGVVDGGQSPEAARYVREVAMGLPPLGTKFPGNRPGLELTITGLNSTGTKVLCKGSDGKEWAVPPLVVIRRVTQAELRES